MIPTTDIDSKLKKLNSIISNYEKIAVMFSGGVDSTFLILAAIEAKRNDVIAVTALGPNFDPEEIDYAETLCNNMHIEHHVVDIGDGLIDAIKDNPRDRCYHCKEFMITSLEKKFPGWTLIDGTNKDDEKDFRPGNKALEEHNIISPLREAGITKTDIREHLKKFGLSIWSRPAFACLATRIPTGCEITEQKLQAVLASEKYLHSLGFNQVRVRHHGDVARIEVPKDEINKFFDENLIKEISKNIKKNGFKYVSLDLSGYTQGDMN